ncbi:MAG: hypothetical protein IKD09_03845 [Lentisphaeria bacterium]|nr:hypothetical protein [Lentisphaeria bacterium]
MNSTVKLLYIYNSFISLAIMNCANVVFMDKFFLRANIDLSAFGFIKGLMYLLPAVSYFILAPWLQKKEIDREICMYGYLARVSVPCLLPLIALFTENVGILTIASAIILPIGMMTATFANNSLMVIYRRALPPESFNKYSNTMLMLLCMPANILGVPMAIFMDLFENSSNQTFYWVYFLIQAICILPEYPAIRAMKQVKLHVMSPPKKKSIRLQDILIPYRDKNYSLIAVITMLHGVTCGSLGAYLVVYLMLTLNWKMSIIVILISVIGIVANITLPFGGKIADKHGFHKVFFIQTAIIFAATALFCICWNNVWVLLLFWLISWDGSGVSIVGAWMNATEMGAGSKLARKGCENYYVSAYNMCRSGGLFLGSFGAMFVYKICENIYGATNYSPLFRSYFGLLLIPIFLMLLVAIIFYRQFEQRRGLKK